MSVERRPRTKEDFDSWFTAKGDPWDYRGRFVRNRLRRTLAFVRRFIQPDFSGHFLEVGAYDGSFTVLLAGAFPRAGLTVNDISAVAMERVKSAVDEMVVGREMSFLVKDFLEITEQDFGTIPFSGSTVILLLECLYYLGSEERKKALENLSALFPDASLFVSGPLGGPPYFNEPELLEALTGLGYRLEALEVLNFRRCRSLEKPLRIIARYFPMLRELLANQVLYFLRKAPRA